jgi:Ca-activated chloride channel family protein
LLPHGPLTAATGATYDVGVKLGPVPKFGVPDGIGDDEQQPAPTTKDLAALLKEGNLPGGLKPQGNSDAWQPGDKGMKKSLSPFDSFVDVKVSIWEDRKAGGGYFKISISPNRESDLLRDIAKDTLIIIDHSASIEVGKLRQFKTASLEALSYLNRRDSFNIVGFNVTSRSLFPGFVPLNDETMANAQNFIRNLFRGGMTDVFGSIAPFVQESNGNPERPLNIFLLTDGQSTVNIYQSDDFIRRVVQMNPGNVSIYPFSAGKDANRELLDFLGYLNRGYNFHAPELKDFKNQLLSYIGEHSSLIIRDLEYMVEGQVGKQIFPRRLPHLYRQETLEILGQYGPQDTELVFTLNGKDADGQVRDLVFRRKYQDCPTATQELPMQWASKKVFHLLAQKTLSEDQQEQARLNREIQALVLKFKLYNPY